jgi:4-hydroxybenzoyl-CoA thioesterase
MTYTTGVRIRFAHVDAAGIVFYPRYFEMINGAVEDFCAEALGASFASLHLDRKIGLPVVKVEANFIAASRLGEWLDIDIEVGVLDRASCALDLRLRAGEALRVSANLVMVCTDLERLKAVAWPEDLRAALGARLRP